MSRPKSIVQISREASRESVLRVQSHIAEVESEIDSMLKRLIKETAIRIHADTIRAAPVKTGSLKTSYSIDLSKIDKNEGSVYTEIEYAPAVEYGYEGGYKQRKQPHLNPAFEKHIDRFYRAVDVMLKKSLR